MIDRDAIIKLAREAGGVPAGGGTFIGGTIDWERFAALVAAAEREACAKRCEAEADDPNNWAYERAMAGHCATAIRARGQA